MALRNLSRVITGVLLGAFGALYISSAPSMRSATIRPPALASNDTIFKIPEHKPTRVARVITVSAPLCTPTAPVTAAGTVTAAESTTSAGTSSGGFVDGLSLAAIIQLLLPILVQVLAGRLVAWVAGNRDQLRSLTGQLEALENKIDDVSRLVARPEQDSGAIKEMFQLRIKELENRVATLKREKAEVASTTTSAARKDEQHFQKMLVDLGRQRQEHLRVFEQRLEEISTSHAAERKMLEVKISELDLEHKKNVAGKDRRIKEDESKIKDLEHEKTLLERTIKETKRLHNNQTKELEQNFDGLVKQHQCELDIRSKSHQRLREMMSKLEIEHEASCVKISELRKENKDTRLNAQENITEMKRQVQEMKCYRDNAQNLAMDLQMQLDSLDESKTCIVCRYAPAVAGTARDMPEPEQAQGSTFEIQNAEPAATGFDWFEPSDFSILEALGMGSNVTMPTSNDPFTANADSNIANTDSMDPPGKMELSALIEDPQLGVFTMETPAIQPAENSQRTGEALEKAQATELTTVRKPTRTTIEPAVKPLIFGSGTNHTFEFNVPTTRLSALTEQKTIDENEEHHSSLDPFIDEQALKEILTQLDRAEGLTAQTSTSMEVGLTGNEMQDGRVLTTAPAGPEESTDQAQGTVVDPPTNGIEGQEAQVSSGEGDQATESVQVPEAAENEGQMSGEAVGNDLADAMDGMESGGLSLKDLMLNAPNEEELQALNALIPPAI